MLFATIENGNERAGVGKDHRRRLLRNTLRKAAPERAARPPELFTMPTIGASRSFSDSPSTWSQRRARASRRNSDCETDSARAARSSFASRSSSSRTLFINGALVLRLKSIVIHFGSDRQAGTTYVPLATRALW